MKTFIISSYAVILVVWANAMVLSAQVNWQQATLPTSETLRFVAMHDSVAIGVGKASVFRSENYGKTWLRVGDSTLPLKNRPTGTWLELKLYATQHRSGKIFFFFDDDVAYRSTDLGRSWQVIPSLREPMAFFTAIGQVFLVLTPSGGIYKSEDGGTQWSKTQSSVLAGLGRIQDVTSNGKGIFVLYPHQVYQGSNTLLRSLDTGKTWETLIWRNLGVNSSLIAQGDTLWAGYIFNQRDTILRSTDNGNSWQFMTQGLPSKSINSLVSSRNNVYISTSDKGGFVFVPSSNSWQPIPTQPIMGYSFFIDLANSSVLFSIDSLMVRSEDEGRTWTSASQGLYPQALFPISPTSAGIFAQEASMFAPENAEFAYFGSVFFSQDKGQSWKPVNISNIGRNGIIQTQTLLWSSPYVTFLSKSHLQNSPSNFVALGNIGTANVVAGNDSILFYDVFGGLVESRNEGATFSPNSLTGSPFDYGFPPPNVRNLFLQGSTVYAATNKGVFLSTDIGRTWTLQTSLQPFQNRIIRPTVLINGNIVFATVDPQRIVIMRTATTVPGNGYALSPDFYRSSDSGKTWERLRLPDSSEVHAIVNIGTTVIVASLKNIYQSTNLGATWERLSQTLPKGKITTLAKDGNTLYTCVGGHGLFRTEITVVGVRNEQKQINILSSVAFPNPASDHADLTFTLPHAAETVVRLYSALGTEVWRSESAFLPAGEQRLRMDVRGLPTGVYAYRLTVGGVQSVGRLVVVR